MVLNIIVNYIKIYKVLYKMIKKILILFLIYNYTNAFVPNAFLPNAFVPNAFVPNIINRQKNKISTVMLLNNNNKLNNIFKMTRPESIPFEFMLPITGSYIVSNNLNILANPTVYLVAILSVIIGSNSMIINDYFDYKNGVDINKKNKILNKGHITTEEVIYISNLLNLISYYLISIINNNLLRIILSNSIISIYIYTPLLKPLPLLKNIYVALTISQSLVVGALVIDKDIIKIIPSIIYLFNIIMWQELILDINDMKNDKKSGIKTIPVIFGYKKTNILSLIFLIMGIILPYLCKEIKLLEFVFFTLLQSPLLFMTFNVIKKNTILNKKAINISRMVILFSGIYFCIL